MLNIICEEVVRRSDDMRSVAWERESIHDRRELRTAKPSMKIKTQRLYDMKKKFFFIIKNVMEKRENQ